MTIDSNISENRNYWLGIGITLIIFCHITRTCYDPNIPISNIFRILFYNGDANIFLNILLFKYQYQHLQ